jgi:hypothetical protein
MDFGLYPRGQSNNKKLKVLPKPRKSGFLFEKLEFRANSHQFGIDCLQRNSPFFAGNLKTLDVFQTLLSQLVG